MDVQFLYQQYLQAVQENRSAKFLASLSSAERFALVEYITNILKEKVK
jgi:hypothetical protein